MGLRNLALGYIKPWSCNEADSLHVVALDANKGFAGEGQRSLFKVVAA
jgi:hypothetical protein